jgi:hypothetical protein
MFITAPTAHGDTGDRVHHLANENSNIKTFVKAPFRSHWVEMAEKKLAVGETAESSSSAGAPDGMNAKDIKARKNRVSSAKGVHLAEILSPVTKNRKVHKMCVRYLKIPIKSLDKG